MVVVVMGGEGGGGGGGRGEVMTRGMEGHRSSTVGRVGVGLLAHHKVRERNKRLQLRGLGLGLHLFCSRLSNGDLSPSPSTSCLPITGNRLWPVAVKEPEKKRKELKELESRAGTFDKRDHGAPPPAATRNFVRSTGRCTGAAAQHTNVHNGRPSQPRPRHASASERERAAVYGARHTRFWPRCAISVPSSQGRDQQEPLHPNHQDDSHSARWSCSRAARRSCSTVRRPRPHAAIRCPPSTVRRPRPGAAAWRPLPAAGVVVSRRIEGQH
jgi:hypothetical protein